MDYPAAWQSEILLPTDESAADEMSAEKTDKQLAELVLAGEETAFREIFERHKRIVAAVAARYFQRQEQIEEIIQISFTKMYFELGNFRGRHELSLAGWLARIATNACLDALRKQKRKPENLVCELSNEQTEFLFAEPAGDEKDSEKLVIERDLAEKLLSQLAAEDRALLQMLYEEEMTVVEIARATGWSSAKIKVRAHRARKALRRILSKIL
jgi:RNA polymerase sigma-70 factor (ECF subfamily)